MHSYNLAAINTPLAHVIRFPFIAGVAGFATPFQFEGAHSHVRLIHQEPSRWRQHLRFGQAQLTVWPYPSAQTLEDS